MATLVYEYGLLQPTENGERVRDQIRLAHRYQNKLVEIERRRREAVRAAMGEVSTVAEHTTRLAAVLAELEVLREGIRAARQATRSRVEMAENARALALRDEARALRAAVKSAKAALKTDPAIVSRLKAIDDVAHQESLAARAEVIEAGLYWGTYLLAEQAMQAAKSGKMDPKFQPWSGDGAVAVQVQSTRPLEDLFGGDTRVRVDPLPIGAWSHPSRGERRRLQRTVLHLRVGSDGRAPIWASWPMVMHRPLPAGARVTWAKVMMRQRSPHPGHDGRAPWARWVVQFTVQVPDTAPRAVETPRVAAVDFGWRHRPDGLRVAYVTGQGGEDREVVVPADEVFDRLDKAESIRGFRDKGIDSVRTKVASVLADVTLPDDVAERVRSMFAWRSPSRFVALQHALSRLDLSGTEPTHQAAIAAVIAELDAWRRRDLHLGQYEGGVRQGGLGHRREIYRRFAADLAERYDVIVLEDFDLRATAKKAKDEETETSTAGLRDQQRRAAPYQLRQAIEQAAGRRGARVIKVSSAYSTRTCNACGKVCAGDMAEAIEYRCEHCHTLWDQDANAARNLLASGQAMLADPVALATHNPAKAPRKARFAKRHAPKSEALQPSA